MLNGVSISNSGSYYYYYNYYYQALHNLSLFDLSTDSSLLYDQILRYLEASALVPSAWNAFPQLFT